MLCLFVFLFTIFFNLAYLVDDLTLCLRTVFKRLKSKKCVRVAMEFEYSLEGILKLRNLNFMKKIETDHKHYFYRSGLHRPLLADLLDQSCFV